MFSHTAQYYDLVYSFKNYEQEVDTLRERLRKEHAQAKSILDVACGSGQHASLLAKDYEVDGIDLEPGFVSIAQKKLPKGRVQLADMRSFDLKRKYDAVLCLFSSIGYLLSTKDIVSALRCFRSHLAEGGVIFVEPWIAPEKWREPHPDMIIVDQPDLKICRMGLSERRADRTVLHFEYLIGRPTGLERLRETHQLLLLDHAALGTCFEHAGLRVEYDEKGLTGRGLFVARAG